MKIPVLRDSPRPVRCFEQDPSRHRSWCRIACLQNIACHIVCSTYRSLFDHPIKSQFSTSNSQTQPQFRRQSGNQNLVLSRLIIVLSSPQQHFAFFGVENYIGCARIAIARLPY